LENLSSSRIRAYTSFLWDKVFNSYTLEDYFYKVDGVKKKKQAFHKLMTWAKAFNSITFSLFKYCSLKLKNIALNLE